MIPESKRVYADGTKVTQIDYDRYLKNLNLDACTSK